MTTITDTTQETDKQETHKHATGTKTSDSSSTPQDEGWSIPNAPPHPIDNTNTKTTAEDTPPYMERTKLYLAEMGNAKERIINGSASEKDWKTAKPLIDIETIGPSLEDQNRIVALKRNLHAASNRVALLERTLERAKREAGIEAPGTDTDTGSIGTLTLADLTNGPAPVGLVQGTFLTSNEPNVFYGPGGVGKGLFCVWLIKQLIADGHKVMIIDFENHEGEWGRRARGMGYTDEELKRVQYREPFGNSWHTKRGTLIDIASAVRDDCDSLDTDIIVIDSYAAATSSGDAMGGKASADEFFEGLKTIGRTSVVIAHVAASANKFPDKPFGSVFVHNYARETWSIENAENLTQEVPYDAETNDLQPAILAIELRNKKMSQRNNQSPQFLTFSFFLDASITVNEHAGAEQMTLADMAADVLDRAEKPLTTAEIVRGIKTDFDQTVKADSMNKTMGRRNARHSFKKLPTPTITWETS